MQTHFHHRASPSASKLSWDLDWQDQYAFAKPVDLPKGTELPERFRDRLLDFVDSNGDGELDAQELEKSRTSFERFLDRKK